MIITEIVDKYIAAVRNWVNKSKIKINIGIYNVIPPKEVDVGNNPEFPFLGSAKERLEYVTFFNECLAKACNEYNVKFVYVIDKYVTENGHLNPVLADGSVHIEESRYVMEYIKEQVRTCR